MNLKLILIGIIILVAIGGILLYMYVWGGGEKREEKPATLENIIENVPKTIDVTSSAFSQGNNIPKQYTCDGKISLYQYMYQIFQIKLFHLY